MKPRRSALRNLLGVAFTLFALVSMYGSLTVLTILLLLFPIVATVSALGSGASVPIIGLLILYPLSWIPGVAIFRGMLHAKPPVGRLPGIEVHAAQFPRLFAEIDALCKRLGTRPPTEVRVMLSTNAFVTDLPHGRRVLGIGVLLFEVLTIVELRAVLSHEIAHFAFGHTAYAGIRGQAFHLFASLKRAPSVSSQWQHWAIRAGDELAAALCRGVFKLFGYVYLRATRPGARRDEFEADAAAADIAGASTMVRVLEKLDVHGPLFDLFLEDELGSMLQRGIAPHNLMVWYEHARREYAARDLTERLATLAREERTDPLATHPAQQDRVRALDAYRQGASLERDLEENEGAAALVERAVEALTHDLTLQASFDAQLGEPKPMTIEEWERDFLPGTLHTHARSTAARLVQWFPEAGSLAGMARCLAEAIRAGQVLHYARIWEPGLWHVAPAHRRSAVALVWISRLLPVYQGALLERGGRVQGSVGASSYRFVSDDGSAWMPADELRALVAGGEEEAITFLEAMKRLEQRDRVLS